MIRPGSHIMSVICEDGEELKKKTVVSILFTPRKRYISRLYVTNTRIIAKNQKKEILKVSYEHVHEITVTDGYRVCIRCNTPHRFFGEKEEYLRLYFHGLKRKEGGVIVPLEDPKWAKAWAKYLNGQVKAYQQEVTRRKHEMQSADDDLLLIEGIQRTTAGLDPFEIVKAKEKMQVWLDDESLSNCVIYATNNRLLIKVRSSDYLVIPYSVIYTYERDRKKRLTITFSFPQLVEGFEAEISRLSLQRIPPGGEEYPAKMEERWFEEWEEFFAQITSLFRKHKGAISHDEMLEMLVEMKHSPTKYNLSTYGKQGWDRACGLALDRFGRQGDDLYLYMNFLLQEYEDMKNRALAEPDPARQDAYLGSEMAYNSILAYINQHTKMR